MKRNSLVLILIIALFALANTACPPPPKDAKEKQAPPDKTLPAPAKETSEDQKIDENNVPPSQVALDPAEIPGFPWAPFEGAEKTTIEEAQQYASLEKPRNSMNQDKFVIPALAVAASNPNVDLFEVFYVQKPVAEVFEYYASKGLHDATHDEDYHKWNHWMSQTTLDKRKELGIPLWRIDTVMLIDLAGEATLINHTSVRSMVKEELDGKTLMHIPPARETDGDAPAGEAEADAAGEAAE